jgi:hypothetical protein
MMLQLSFVFFDGGRTVDASSSISISGHFPSASFSISSAALTLSRAS